MVNNQGIIIHKTGHKKGKRYDYNIYKNNHPVIQCKLSACLTVVIEVERDFPDQKSSLPNRKMRNQELAKEEKSKPEPL